MSIPFYKLSGLDIVGEPDESDLRSLAEVEAFARSDRYVEPTQETTELAARLHAENTEAVRQYRWEMQEELAQEGERIGRILSEEEFFRLLSQIATIRVNDWSARGMRGLSVWRAGEWKYCCAVQCGYMPEFSVMRFDEHGLPTNEKYRGWRTVGLRLITQGFISEADFHRVFGCPLETSASRRYLEQLKRYRQYRAGFPRITEKVKRARPGRPPTKRLTGGKDEENE